MRRLLLPSAVLLVLLLLGFDSPKEYDDTTGLVDGLEGSWECVAQEHNGQTIMFRKTVQTFHGRKWEETTGGHRQTGSYTADPRQKPGRLDIGGDDLPRRCSIGLMVIPSKSPRTGRAACGPITSATTGFSSTPTSA